MKSERSIKEARTLAEKYKSSSDLVKSSLALGIDRNQQEADYLSYITYLMGQGLSKRIEAANIMVEENMPFVPYYVRKMLNIKEVPKDEKIEDIESIAIFALIKAVYTFDTTKKIKLTSYAAKCMHNEILMSFRKQKNNSNIVSMEEPVSINGNGEYITLNQILGSGKDEVLDVILGDYEIETLYKCILKLSPKERYVILNRFGFLGEDKTQKEIAKELRLSQSYACRLEKSALKKLKKTFKKLNDEK